MEDDSILIPIEIAFDTTRTIMSTLVVLESMLTVGALKLPSLLSCGEMRERRGNAIDNGFFYGHIF